MPPEMDYREQGCSRPYEDDSVAIEKMGAGCSRPYEDDSVAIEKMGAGCSRPYDLLRKGEQGCSRPYYKDVTQPRES